MVGTVTLLLYYLSSTIWFHLASDPSNFLIILVMFLPLLGIIPFASVNLRQKPDWRTADSLNCLHGTAAQAVRAKGESHGMVAGLSNITSFCLPVYIGLTTMDPGGESPHLILVIAQAVLVVAALGVFARSYRSFARTCKEARATLHADMTQLGTP